LNDITLGVDDDEGGWFVKPLIKESREIRARKP